MPVIDTLMGKLVCAFATGLGMWTGHRADAAALCLFIQANDL